MESMNVGENVGENVDVNLNNIERTIIELILKEPTLTSEKISIKIEKNKNDSREIFKSITRERLFKKRWIR